MLDIIANVLRSFLLKENVPEDETEALVGRVKEKKMGELFANMDKMDIQVERWKTAEERHRADEERENRIRDVVSVGKQFGATKEEIADRIQKSHGIDLKNAMEKVDFYWNQPESAENEFKQYNLIGFGCQKVLGKFGIVRLNKKKLLSCHCGGKWIFLMVLSRAAISGHGCYEKSAMSPDGELRMVASV